MLLLPVFLVAVFALILGASAPGVWAEEDENEFEVAELFFELNNTDGDLGIHALVDGGPWKKLEIEDPRDRDMLDIYVKGRLRRQGLTEIFFESAEPTFDELPPERFFRRFPEGTYEIEGITLEGEELENEVELTHLMPAPADGIRLSGDAINLEYVNCEDEDTIPVVTDRPVTISWDPVTDSHPEIGRTGEEVEIVNYELVVEVEWEVMVDGELEEFTSVFSIILPPSQTSVTIPEELIDIGVEEADGEFKYEILAREESYNQTAVESCFVIEEENAD
jgi:hypothetical protein